MIVAPPTPETLAVVARARVERTERSRRKSAERLRQSLLVRGISVPVSVLLAGRSGAPLGSPARGTRNPSR